VPWKYGFKGAKSIVRIRFTERQPLNTWQESAPQEYGFYSNVNPSVDHPRWSQASERRIGEFFKRKTLMFKRLRRAGPGALRGTRSEKELLTPRPESRVPTRALALGSGPGKTGVAENHPFRRQALVFVASLGRSPGWSGRA